MRVWESATGAIQRRSAIAWRRGRASRPSLGKYKVASDSDLKKATLDAIAQANAFVDLKKAMETVLKDSKALAARSVRDVQALITSLKIVP